LIRQIFSRNISDTSGRVNPQVSITDGQQSQSSGRYWAGMYGFRLGRERYIRISISCSWEVLAQEKAQQCLPEENFSEQQDMKPLRQIPCRKKCSWQIWGKKDNSDIDLDLETLVSDAPTECYVMAEEFNDFIGQGDLPFVTRLTKLWDCPAEFRHPKLHGKSVYVYKPTVNILGANTQQNFSMAIPPEAIGNGFCSRFLFIHSEPTGKFITFPDEDNKELRDALVERLKKIRASCNGPMRIDPDAKPIFDRIYKEFKPIDDHRFTHYSTRRFTHILKLCIIIASANLRKVITSADAVNANTVLHAAERRMPKALGEFGKARNSGAAAAILDHLNRSTNPNHLMNSGKSYQKI
jgi:hypothetical protein